MLVQLQLSTIPLAMLLSAVVGTFLCDSARAQQPFFMGLGDLPGGAFFSWATDVSYDGSAVTGWSITHTDDRGVYSTDAFRWTRETGMVGLGVVDAYNDIKISADGSTIVGNGGGGHPERQVAFRWTQAPGPVPLQFGGSSYPGVAWNVNGDGTTVVGSRQDVAGRNKALRWTQPGNVDLLFTDISETLARDISSDGSVILGQTGPRIFVWTESEAITFIEGTTNASGVQPTISSNGQVVVGSDIIGAGPNGLTAFRWTRDNGLQHLGPLPDGKRTRSATGVSADGSVVTGNSELDIDDLIAVPGTSIGVGSEPFIWDETHGLRYLFDVLRDDYGLAGALAGWSDFATVRGISGDGRTIVGLGVNPAGNGEAWIAHLGPPTQALPGDFNSNGTVDDADYVGWRNNNGTQQEYETWRTLRPNRGSFRHQRNFECHSRAQHTRCRRNCAVTIRRATSSLSTNCIGTNIASAFCTAPRRSSHRRHLCAYIPRSAAVLHGPGRPARRPVFQFGNGCVLRWLRHNRVVI